MMNDQTMDLPFRNGVQWRVPRSQQKDTCERVGEVEWFSRSMMHFLSFFPIPDAPWDWNIYLHILPCIIKCQASDAGKYWTVPFWAFWEKVVFFPVSFWRVSWWGSNQTPKETCFLQPWRGIRDLRPEELNQKPGECRQQQQQNQDFLEIFVGVDKCRELFQAKKQQQRAIRSFVC